MGGSEEPGRGREERQDGSVCRQRGADRGSVCGTAKGTCPFPKTEHLEKGWSRSLKETSSLPSGQFLPRWEVGVGNQISPGGDKRGQGGCTGVPNSPLPPIAKALALSPYPGK